MANKKMIVLGIETSCDETSASVVEQDKIETGKILSNVIYSQLNEHRDYGGVVPEIAARSHINNLGMVIEEALSLGNTKLKELDAISVTNGPGLKGGLIVGVTMANAISSSSGIPLIGINHLEGHALTIRMNQKINFPYLLLLLSGGHTQMLIVNDVGQYKRLGTTIDDALGEAYDKVAKSLNLGYPGGPIIEEMASLGQKKQIKFPRPLINSNELNFSFSGLKTAVRREIERVKPINESTARDICAGFQEAVIEILLSKLSLGINKFRKLKNIPCPNVVIAGGVASNKEIFASLTKLGDDLNFNVLVPPRDLCTDNAAMIAWAGIERLRSSKISAEEIEIKPRWPLDSKAKQARGAGVKA
tara:strand:- start:3456 stop:4538 length:1083 start_codon:yes stop_codon:yes gene_type:complete